MSSRKATIDTIRANSAPIVEAIDRGETKSSVATRYKIHPNALNAAFKKEGRYDLMAPWYRKRFYKYPQEAKPTSEYSTSSPQKVPSAIEVASALLEEAAKAINREEAYRSEVSLLTEVVGKLEREVTSLKQSLAEEVKLLKQKELEVERYRKIHNTIVEESKKVNKPLPTVDSILELLRKRGVKL